MRFIAKVIAIILCAGLMAFAESADLMLMAVSNPTTISFKEAFKRALEKNSSLKKVELGVVIGDSDTELAASRLLPKLSAVGSYATSIGSLPNSADDNNATAGIKLSTPLLDTKLLVDVKVKRESALSMKEKYQYEQDALISDVGGLYIEALMAEAIKDIAHEELEQYERQVLLLERKASLGDARSLDVTKAQYSAHKANSDYVLKNQEFLKKMGELGNKIGMNENFILSAVSIESPHLAKDQKTLLAMATTSADVNAAKRDIKAAEFSLLGERLDFLPKLSATVDGGWLFPYDNGSLASSRAFSMKMMLNVEIPLFSGGSSLAAIKSKIANRTVQELTLRSKINDKELAINGLIQQIKDFQMAKISAELALALSTNTKASVERLFDLREATWFELREARTDHFSAKNQAATAGLKLEHTRLRLLFVIGKIQDLM